MRNLLFCLVLLSFPLSFTGCFNDGRQAEYVIIDQDVFPARLVHTEKVDVKVKTLNMETGLVTDKVVNIADYAGWYMLHPKTFQKLIAAALAPTRGIKVIVVSPESDPFTFDDDSEQEINIRAIEVDRQEEVVGKRKIKELKGWIVLHPTTYKRLLSKGLQK